MNYLVRKEIRYSIHMPPEIEEKLFKKQDAAINFLKYQIGDAHCKKVFHPSFSYAKISILVIKQHKEHEAFSFDV